MRSSAPIPTRSATGRELPTTCTSRAGHQERPTAISNPRMDGENGVLATAEHEHAEIAAQLRLAARSAYDEADEARLEPTGKSRSDSGSDIETTLRSGIRHRRPLPGTLQGFGYASLRARSSVPVHSVRIWARRLAF
jgi:hypothetical protein